MGNLVDKIQKAIQSKQAIKNALIAKGLTVGDKMSDYATLIASLPSNPVNSITYTGTTYNTATYFTQAGTRVGYNNNNEVFITMQGGTTSSYENIFFNPLSLPTGMTMLRVTNGAGYGTSGAVGGYFTFVLTGVTGKINVTLELTGVNSTYDYVQVNVTVTYVV